MTQWPSSLGSSTFESVENLKTKISQTQTLTVQQGIDNFKELLDEAIRLRKASGPAEEDAQLDQIIKALTTDIDRMSRFASTELQKRMQDVQNDLSALQLSITHPITVPPTTQNTPAGSPTSHEAVKDQLNNFQKEAREAILAVSKNREGKLDDLSLRKALDYLGQLWNIANITPGSPGFEWLQQNEKEALVQQMPAVRGVLGSIFTQYIFDAGYQFSFNGDNTINVRVKTPSQAGIDAANSVQQQINDAITRNPNIANILKEGLLYGDNDLLHYLQSRADANGQNIPYDAQTPEAFLKHLRSTHNLSDSARAILDSTGFFNGVNFGEEMRAASIVPDMSHSLTVAMQNEKNMTPEQRATVQQQAEQVKQHVTAVPSEWKNNGTLGTILGEVGSSFGEGVRQVVTSPWALIGAILVMIIGRKMTGGWTWPFIILLGGMLGLGAYERHKSSSSWTPNTTVNTEAGVDDLVTKDQVDKHVSETAENDPEKIAFIKSVYPENYLQLQKYLQDQTGQISEENKTMLQNPKAQEAVTAEMNKIKDKIDTFVGYASWWNVEMKNQILDDLTVETAIKLSEITDPNQAAISLLNDAIEAEKDPEKKQQLQNLKNFLEQAQKTGTPEEKKDAASITRLILMYGVWAFFTLWTLVLIIKSTAARVIFWFVKNTGWAAIDAIRGTYNFVTRTKPKLTLGWVDVQFPNAQVLHEYNSLQKSIRQECTKLLTRYGNYAAIPDADIKYVTQGLEDRFVKFNTLLDNLPHGTLLPNDRARIMASMAYDDATKMSRMVKMFNSWWLAGKTPQEIFSYLMRRALRR